MHFFYFFILCINLCIMFFFYYDLLLLGYNKTHKNQKSTPLDIETRSTDHVIRA